MLDVHSAFDDILRQLTRLASRRRLFDDEFYQATRLMGMLTMHCYEEAADSSAEKRSQSSRSKASLTRSMGTSATDHTAGLYLTLIGRGVAIDGEAGLVVKQLDTHMGSPARMLRRGDRVEIVGQMYRVRAASAEAQTVLLENPVSFEMSTPSQLAVGDREVWIYLENRSATTNKDMQMLLLSMQAHTPVLQLLRLPFKASEVLLVKQELQTRAVLRAAYRLLKAMAIGFNLTQLALAPYLSFFLTHTEANLISHDISPTGCINAIFANNRPVCVQVDEKVIHKFADMAAAAQAPPSAACHAPPRTPPAQAPSSPACHAPPSAPQRRHLPPQAPRFIRFLRMIVSPNGVPIKVCRFLVVL